MAGMKFGKYRSLHEAYEQLVIEANSVSQFQALLKDGLRFLFFDEFAGIATEWQNLVMTVPSDRQFETWMKNQGIGTFPIIGEGESYPRILAPDLKPEIGVRNDKRGGILEITEELIKFDRYGEIMRNVRDMANAAAQTREEAVFTVLTTTGNFTAVAADNTAGNNNTSTNGLSPANFITAYNTLTTMIDRASGRPLGIRPDTLVVTPNLYFFARQMMLSPTIQRTGPSSSSDVYGQGETNPFFGVVDRVISSFWLLNKGTSQAWLLGQRGRGVILQEVEPLQLLEAGRDVTNEAYLDRDVYRYRARDWFGVGMVDSRYWYYANSTTAGVPS